MPLAGSVDKLNDAPLGREGEAGALMPIGTAHPVSGTTSTSNAARVLAIVFVFTVRSPSGPAHRRVCLKQGFKSGFAKQMAEPSRSLFPWVREGEVLTLTPRVCVKEKTLAMGKEATRVGEVRYPWLAPERARSGFSSRIRWSKKTAYSWPREALNASGCEPSCTYP